MDVGTKRNIQTIRGEMIFLKGMRRLDRVGNIGMKVPITKIGMTHEGEEKIVEDLKKAEGIGEAPHQTLGVSHSRN